MPKTIEIAVVSGEYQVARLAPNAVLPPAAMASPFWAITKTTDELSVVCLADAELDPDQAEGGWALLKVLGPLEFSLTGILAGIAKPLAAVEISIFAISTFDTDYILVKQAQLAGAISTLREAGFRLHS